MADEATPFEVKLADGSVVKAADMAEGFKTLAKMKEDTSAALKEEREQRAQMQVRLDAMSAEIAASKVPPHKDGDFNRDHYYKLVGEDPVMAQNYIDAYRFGIADP